MDDELHKTMERLRDSIGSPPEQMTERLVAHAIRAFNSQQETDAGKGKGSAARRSSRR